MRNGDGQVHQEPIIRCLIPCIISYLTKYNLIDFLKELSRVKDTFLLLLVPDFYKPQSVIRL